MKRCPYCAEEIQDEAIKCRYCQSNLMPAASPGARATPRTTALPRAATPEPATTVGQGAVRFTHSGQRFVLGYGIDFFGIWDRTTPGPAVARFARTDQGWNQAWNQFLGWEPRSMAVPQTSPPPDMRAATGQFKPAHGAASWAIGLLVATAASSLILMVVSIAHAVSWNAATTGLLGADDQTRFATLAGLQGLLYSSMILVAIPWLIWESRSQANLRSFGLRPQYSPGWSVGWWFVPFANLVLPILVMAELWRGSDPTPPPGDWARRPLGPLPGVWWGLWLAHIGAFWIAVNGIPNLLTSAEAATRSWLLAVSDLVTGVSAAAAILVVREVDRRQEARRLQTAGVTPQPGAWGQAPAV